MPTLIAQPTRIHAAGNKPKDTRTLVGLPFLPGNTARIGKVIAVAFDGMKKLARPAVQRKRVPGGSSSQSRIPEVTCPIHGGSRR